MKLRTGIMEYKIYSGSKVEIRRCRMRLPDTGVVRRGCRVRKSSMAQIRRNENEAVLNLARLINCNFGKGDLWVTLTFDDEHLPRDRAEAGKELEKLFRKIRRSVEGFRYIKALGEKDSRSGEEVRLHWHILLPREAEEKLYELWPSRNDVTIRHLDGSGDYTRVAVYMIANATTGEEGGAKRYSCSKGLKQPEYTEPTPCKIHDEVRIPEGAKNVSKSLFGDGYSGFQAAYLSYTKPKSWNGKYKKVRWND